LTLDGGRSVSIDRSHLVFKDYEEPVKPTLKSGIQYMKVASFSDPKFEAAAIDSLREHKGARAFIIDLRGNGGGSTPSDFIRALMDRPYRGWSEETPLNWLGSDSGPVTGNSEARPIKL
jgi:carboxyl-terminal processing protease